MGITAVRRRSLVLSALCLLGAGGPASVQGDDAVPPVQIADGVQLIEGRYVPGAQPDGNSVLFSAPEGAVVFDTGRHAAQADRIIAALDADGRLLAAIVNSHWHLDHISGNPRLLARWPQAQTYMGDALDRAQLVDMRGRTTDAAQRADRDDEIARIDAAAQAHPTVTITSPGERIVAGKPFVFGTARAATLCDVWLYDPASRVLASGDLVTLPAPFFDTACPARWRAAFADLADTGFVTLVPGHGAPMDRAGFDTYRRAFHNLLACAAAPTRDATCIAGWKHDAAPLLRPGDDAAVDGLLGYYFSTGLRGRAAQADCTD
jgi:glyoxylase-like metal-dependent hydrolase (beta-lactamase superfamily II)